MALLCFRSTARLPGPELLMMPLLGADPVLDTKALLAWNRHTALLCFRGTASLTNALSDLKVGQAQMAWTVALQHGCLHQHRLRTVKQGCSWCTAAAGAFCTTRGAASSCRRRRRCCCSPAAPGVCSCARLVPASAGVDVRSRAQARFVADGLPAPGAPRLLEGLACQGPGP